MTTATGLFDQIEQLNQPSEREKEILAVSPKGRIAKELLKEFRQIQFERDVKVKTLIRQGWQRLQELGYKKYDRRGNAAYEAGHSDNNEGYGSEDFYIFWGVVAPDGTEFPGSVQWTEGILPAIKHANL